MHAMSTLMETGKGSRSVLVPMYFYAACYVGMH